MAKQRKQIKGIRLPKTPIARLPRKRRDELRKAMLLFIKDTHGSLCGLNPNIGTMGLEASLETMEELHEQGYMYFDRDEKEKHYGFRVWLYDDESGVYDEVTMMWEKLREREEEDEHWAS